MPCRASGQSQKKSLHSAGESHLTCWHASKHLRGRSPRLFRIGETVLGTKPVGAAASNFRRLFFECHAMALRDLQSRLDRSDTSEIKILPLAEKVQRLENLKAKFPGVMLSTTLEPSHNLIDKVVHQFEDNCVKLIELNACTSREQEIRCDKTSPQITFDHSGNIKVTKQSQVTECSIQGEIRLRAAFTRRSLAYELSASEASPLSWSVIPLYSHLACEHQCLSCCFRLLDHLLTLGCHKVVDALLFTRGRLHLSVLAL